MTLDEFINDLPPRKHISVGVASGYAFIGTVAQFRRWVEDTKSAYLLKKNVIRTYDRITEPGIAVITDSSLAGRFWSREDMEADRQFRIKMARKPVERQCVSIREAGLDPKDWLIVNESDRYLVLTDRGPEQRMRVKIPRVIKGHARGKSTNSI